MASTTRATLTQVSNCSSMAGYFKMVHQNDYLSLYGGKW